MTLRVGFLGAGQLGEPMVRRLIGAGHSVSVFARRGDVRERLRDEGAAMADSVAELASGSDILISCLFSDAQLRETDLGPDGFIANAKPGSVFVSHTTGTVAALTELSESASSPPAIVDAPVSGTAEHIAEGKLTVLIGGAADAVQRVRPVLAAYADPTMCTGELGTALDLKLINNVLFAANAQLVAAAVALARQLDVAPDAFASVAAPFLRKDVAAAVSAVERIGADMGFLRSVVEKGPLPLAGGR